MSDDYEIECGIPLPKAMKDSPRTAKALKALSAMAVGDSFVAPDSEYNISYRVRERLADHRTFKTRRMPNLHPVGNRRNLIRVWRVK